MIKQLFLVAFVLFALLGCKKLDPIQNPDDQEINDDLGNVDAQEPGDGQETGDVQDPGDEQGAVNEPAEGDDRVISIPDPVFEEYLAAYDSDKTINGQVLYGDIKNIDKLYLSSGFVNPFSILDANRLTVSDLTGIEHFTKLRSLTVDTAKMPELDLTENSNLEHLDCSGFYHGEVYHRSLKKLKLPPGDKLKTLICNYTWLEELPLEGFPNLERLSFTISEKLMNVKVDKNPNLVSLTGNRQAPPMDLSHNKKLKRLDGMVLINQQTLKNKPDLEDLYVVPAEGVVELNFCENPKITRLKIVSAKLARVIVPTGISQEKIQAESWEGVTVSRCK